MNRKELIKSYINFFKSKNHAEIKNSSLIPENDPTVLFTTAGMQPLIPFLLGEGHPQGKRLVNVQRCIRTGDIDEVGDTTHHTFFEMLGNWSLGDYFKKDAIEYSFEFLTKVLKIPVERLAVSVFDGDKNSPRDEESREVWKFLGVPEDRIAFLSKKENWWGPAGKTGPCGPDTEMFYWKPNNKPVPTVFDCGDSNWVEILNDVFMEYSKENNGKYNEAKQRNIDTGMGVERMMAVLNRLEDNYLSDCWKPIIEKIEELSNKSYEGNGKVMRIIADHVKASVFMIADGVTPSNTEQGYVLRRLIRRAIRFGRVLGTENFITKVADAIYPIYDDYQLDAEKINLELAKEEEKFNLTLEKGLKIFEKYANSGIKELSGGIAFLLYQSYGFPIEMIKEFADEKGIKVDEKGFHEAFLKHQKLSRTASSGKFKSGLADNSEATMKLHTACHLLNEALRIALGRKDIYQKGSNITPERLRFDFNFDRGLTPEEIKDVESLVNQKIGSGLQITCEIMSLKKAGECGAQGVFDSKYGEDVRVYSIGDFSKEICSGSHVENTSELGQFKIIKEQSSSAGVRRIKAVLE
ncbi:alanine--tRNA ligase [Candidatus Pacearchaeota archaeon]|nr:alanine--tRNA ligase [Candidatus Pacearchaeota archaeon]